MFLLTTGLSNYQSKLCSKSGHTAFKLCEVTNDSEQISKVQVPAWIVYSGQSFVITVHVHIFRGVFVEKHTLETYVEGGWDSKP